MGITPTPQFCIQTATTTKKTYRNPITLFVLMFYVVENLCHSAKASAAYKSISPQ